jgi:hypothetical protein
LTGIIPPEVWGCTKLKEVTFSRNNLNGELMGGGRGGEFRCAGLRELNLHENMFEGCIPLALGECCQLLVRLDLYDALSFWETCLDRDVV